VFSHPADCQNLVKVSVERKEQKQWGRERR
jgi:hypothetical protein